MGDVEIGVDEYVEKGLKKMGHGFRARAPTKTRPTLQLSARRKQFFFLTSGSAIHGELELDGENAPNETRTEASQKNSFGITGDTIRFVATEKSIPGGNSIFIATRLTKPKNEPDRALRLAKGRLRFVDWTQAGQVQILAKAQMTALTQDDGSYLKSGTSLVRLKVNCCSIRHVQSARCSSRIWSRGGTGLLRFALSKPLI